MKKPLLQSLRSLVIACLFLVRPTDAQTWSTFLGGTDDDRTYAVARDSSGFVYVAGHTLSTNFPVTPGVYTSLAPAPSGWNVFVCKLDPNGVLASQLVWSTLIGGSGDDEAFDVSLDPSGNVIVIGRTSSTNFPVQSAYSPVYNGGANDAFVLKLSANGTALLYSTFLGGTGDDYGLAIRDSNGILTISGCTDSPNFPKSNNAYQSLPCGLRDVFIARIDPALGAGGLLYGTYLGGSGNDGFGLPSPTTGTGVLKSIGLHVDSQGVTTVAGPTDSGNLPVSPGAYQPTNAGSFDAFVTMLDPALPPATQLSYSTYLGAFGNDAALTVDRIGSDRIVIGGYTYSGLFPVTSGAYGTTFNGTPGIDNDMFLAILDKSQVGGAQLAYSSFIGGNSFEALQTLAADPSGAIVFGGFTRSSAGPTTLPFPTTAGALAPIALPSLSNPMGVVGRLNPAGTGPCDLEYSTFLGGSTAQQVTAIAFDPNLGVHVAGMTVSTNFPTSPGAYQPAYGGGARDAWTAQLDLLPSGNLPGGAFFGALRYGWGTPAATAGGPVMMVGDGPAPGSSCFSLICRRAPANASGFLGFTYACASINTTLPAPFLVGGAAVWLDPSHPTFTLLPVGPSNPLGGCVVPVPLTGVPASLGLQVITQFGWIDPVTGAIATSDVLRIYV